MCLTIPKKVISIKKDMISILPYNSAKVQRANSIISIKKGDWVFTQGGIITNKISAKQAQEIINLIKNK